MKRLYPQVILARVAQEHDCRDGEDEPPMRR